MKRLAIPILLSLIAAGARAAESPDPASNPPPQPRPLAENELHTRVSGRWQSEILMTERQRVVYLGNGRYGLGRSEVFPFFNTIGLDAEEIGHPGLSLHFQGWAGLDLGALYFDQRIVADPTYLYLEFLYKGFDVRVGRQQIFFGAARGLHLDGAFFSYQSPINLGIQALGGLIVTPDLGPAWYRGEQGDSYRDFGAGFSDWQSEGDFGDWAAGGRLFYRLAGVASAGISILHRSLWSELAYEEAGADLDVVPCKWVAISGDALLSVASVGLKEANARVDVYPLETLSLAVDYRHADPSLYLAHTSIFSVFSDERYDGVGGTIYGKPNRRITLHAGYHHLFYGYIDKQVDAADSSLRYRKALDYGYDTEAGITWNWGTEGGMTRFNYRRFEQDQNGMHEVVAGTIIPLPAPGLSASANAYIDLYDDRINDQRIGFFGDAGLLWRYRGWETGGSFLAGVTPYADHDLRGIVKVAYRWDVRFLERGRK